MTGQNNTSQHTPRCLECKHAPARGLRTPIEQDEADRREVLQSLQDLADTGNQEAKRALADLRPQEAADSAADPVKSGATKAMIVMGLCDQDQARLGREPFEYDPEIKALCGLWLEAYRRAQAGDTLFRRLFERELTAHDRTVLDFE